MLASLLKNARILGQFHMTRDGIYRQYGWQFTKENSIDSNVPDLWLTAINNLCAKVTELIPVNQRQAFQWQELKAEKNSLVVTFNAPESLYDEVCGLVSEAISTCQPHPTIQLIKVAEYCWQDNIFPIWQPVDNQGKPLSGGVVFLNELPQAVKTQFNTWLASQPLSISRPPLGMPRHSASYFAQDVVTALERIDKE